MGYFPHSITREALNVLTSGTKGPIAQKLHTILKADFTRRGENYSDFVDNLIKTKHHGSLENPRIADWPEFVMIDGKKFQLLETSPELIESYIHNAAKRLGIVKVFGQGSLESSLKPRIEAHVQALYPDNRKLQLKEAKRIVDAFNYWQGSKHLTQTEGIVPGALKGGWNLTRGAQLTWSQITNAAQGDVPAIGLFGMRNALIGKIKAIGGDKTLKRMEQEGHLFKRVLGSLGEMRDIGGEEKFAQFTRKIAHRWLNLLHVNRINRHINRAGTAAAYEYFGSAAKSKDMARLNELGELFGFDEARIARIALDGKLSEQDMIRLAQKIPAKVNAMSEDPFESPMQLREGGWKYVLAYLSIVRRIGITFKYVVHRAYTNPNPRTIGAAMAMTAALGIGEAVKDELKRALMGTKRPKQETPTWYIINNIIENAMFGLPGAAVGAVTETIQYGRPLSEAVAPPAMAPAETALRHIVRPLARGQEPDWLKAVSRTFPITAPLINRMPQEERPKLEGRRSGRTERTGRSNPRR